MEGGSESWSQWTADDLAGDSGDDDDELSSLEDKFRMAAKLESDNSDFSELEEDDFEAPPENQGNHPTDPDDDPEDDRDSLYELEKELTEAADMHSDQSKDERNPSGEPWQPQPRTRDHPTLIEAVTSIDHPKRFKITPTSAPVGTILKLKLLKQYPHQQTVEKPLFELADLSEQYDKMEQEMVKLYSNFADEPLLDWSHITKGSYAVIQSWKEEEEENEDIPEETFALDPPILKRIKFITVPTDDAPVCEVEYIDYYFKRVIDSNSEVMWLDQDFAVLPPRVCAIEMEGLSHYKNVGVNKFIRYDSDQYLFDGILTAEVQPSGKVLVWSDRFPKKDYPYGINGFIIESILETLQRIPKLPPQGYHRPDGYVVYVTHEGHVNLQFKSVIFEHFSEIFSTIDQDKIRSLHGSVLVPNEHEIYMAPHVNSDGTYYRAVLHGTPSELFSSSSSSASSRSGVGEGQVRVRYLDYGDDALVKVKDLVRAQDVHFLLAKFPSLYIKAHLDNIWSINRQVYFPRYHGKDQAYNVHVVKDSVPAEKVYAEVVLTWTDENDNDEKVCNLNKILEKSEDAADAIVKYFPDNDKPLEDGGLYPANFSNKPLPYLGLGHGRRLKVGDELAVIFKYDKRMPGRYFFIVPEHRVNKLKEIEDKLDKVSDNIRRVRNAQLDNGEAPFMWHIKLSGRCRGLGVLCKSRRVGRLARAVLVNKHPEGKPEKRVLENGVKFTFVSRIWDVFLLDYGIVEKVDVVDMFETRSYCVEMPAIGCLAYQKGMDSKEKTESWWKSLPDYQRQPEGKYDHYWLAKGTVRVKFIDKTFKHYGEVVEVEFL